MGTTLGHLDCCFFTHHNGRITERRGLKSCRHLPWGLCVPSKQRYLLASPHHYSRHLWKPAHCHNFLICCSGSWKLNTLSSRTLYFCTSALLFIFYFETVFNLSLSKNGTPHRHCLRIISLHWGYILWVWTQCTLCNCLAWIPFAWMTRRSVLKSGRRWEKLLENGKVIYKPLEKLIQL